MTIQGGRDFAIEILCIINSQYDSTVDRLAISGIPKENLKISQSKESSFLSHYLALTFGFAVRNTSCSLSFIISSTCIPTFVWPHHHFWYWSHTGGGGSISICALPNESSEYFIQNQYFSCKYHINPSHPVNILYSANYPIFQSNPSNHRFLHPSMPRNLKSRGGMADGQENVPIHLHIVTILFEYDILFRSMLSFPSTITTKHPAMTWQLQCVPIFVIRSCCCYPWVLVADMTWQRHDSTSVADDCWLPFRIRME